MRIISSIIVAGILILGIEAGRPLNERALGEEPKRNPVLANLPEGRWIRIHEQKSSELRFRRQPHGGSCFDTKRGDLILFGSDSHGRDFTNSPLRFSTIDLKWSRDYDDDPREAYTVTDEGLPVAGPNRDHPWATHTFGSVVYDESRDEMIVPIFDDHLVPGRFTDAFAQLWPLIKRKPTWTYSLATAKWSPLPGDGVSCFPYCATYDSDRQVIVAVRPDGIHELAGEPRVWKRATRHGFFGWHTNCAYDRRSRAVVVFGSNENSDEIAAYFPQSGEYRKQPTPGRRPPKDQHNPMESRLREDGRSRRPRRGRAETNGDVALRPAGRRLGTTRNGRAAVCLRHELQLGVRSAPPRRAAGDRRRTWRTDRSLGVAARRERLIRRLDPLLSAESL